MLPYQTVAGGTPAFSTHAARTADLYRKATRRGPQLVALDAAMQLFGQSAERGALSLTYAAAEPSLRGRSGQYIGCFYLPFLPVQLFPFLALSPRNPVARSAHARYRLYDQTAEALEQFLRRPLPHRLKGVWVRKEGHGAAGHGGKTPLEELEVARAKEE